MVTFVESGMTFGPYKDEDCFRVEQSQTYIAVQHGVQMAEFLLYRVQDDNSPMIWIVEAKQSSPRPETQPSFNEFIGEIRDKLANALGLGIASILNRHAAAANELPGMFKSLDLTTAGFRLVLIINGHKKAWLPPIKDALRIALNPTVRLWALGPLAVVVINHEQAREIGLISAP